MRQTSREVSGLGRLNRTAAADTVEMRDLILRLAQLFAVLLVLRVVDRLADDHRELLGLLAETQRVHGEHQVQPHRNEDAHVVQLQRPVDEPLRVGQDVLQDHDALVQVLERERLPEVRPHVRVLDDEPRLGGHPVRVLVDEWHDDVDHLFRVVRRQHLLDEAQVMGVEFEDRVVGDGHGPGCQFLRRGFARRQNGQVDVLALELADDDVHLEIHGHRRHVVRGAHEQLDERHAAVASLDVTEEERAVGHVTLGHHALERHVVALQQDVVHRRDLVDPRREQGEIMRRVERAIHHGPPQDEAGVGGGLGAFADSVVTQLHEDLVGEHLGALDVVAQVRLPQRGQQAGNHVAFGAGRGNVGDVNSGHG